METTACSALSEDLEPAVWAYAAHTTSTTVRDPPELRGAKGDSLDGNLSQLHLIAGQGAGLVAEDIVNLAQVLIQVGVASTRVLFRHGVLHFLVKVDVNESLPAHTWALSITLEPISPNVNAGVDTRTTCSVTCVRLLESSNLILPRQKNELWICVPEQQQSNIQQQLPKLETYMKDAK